MAKKYHLISSLTCPWVQRSVILLRVKKVDFDVTYINLREKPDWFLEISPHGKVPVLKVDDKHILFESNAIAEFLDETFEPRLHPADPIKRAQNRAWTDFIPDFAKGLTGINYAKSKEEVDEAVKVAAGRVARVEEALRHRGNDGPYFNGEKISLVDCGYGPFFQRFNICDSYLQTGLFDQFPLVAGWSKTLLSTDAIVGAVAANFVEEYKANLGRRGAYTATLIPQAEAAE